MKIPPWARLLLYMAMSAIPFWIDFFKLSTDYSLRGLAMPILSSLLAMVTVALARTTSTGPADQPPEEPAHEDPPHHNP
jgi:hypothetical protein